VFVTSHAKTDAELIANAMSAAPLAISRDATVIAMDNDKMRTIRQGKGEFTCVSDDPGSPGNDPMCLDRNAMEWLQAWLDHKDAQRANWALSTCCKADRTPVTTIHLLRSLLKARSGSQPVRIL
jgi:hypothetical protein